MKITSMQTNGNRQTAGFTLIEMIGVLAVIAILAALLLPKVANAINDSKINSTVGSYQTVQTAVDQAYGKYLALNSLMGTNLPLAQLGAYDTTILIPEGYLDHPFTGKVGSGFCVECVTNTSCNAGLGYYLAGTSNGTPSTLSMQLVVECCISNVSAADANAVSAAVDGSTMTPTIGTWDTTGKVCWNPANNVLYMFVEGR